SYSTRHFGHDIDDDDPDEGEDDYDAFDLHWTQEFGLRSGPALRHVVGDDFDSVRLEESYAAGLQPAVDLYGDITRLEAGDHDGFSDDDPGPGDNYRSVVGHGSDEPVSSTKKRR